MSSLLQKQSLTTEQLQLLASEMSKKQKSSGVAWLLWFFTGGIGGHRFYLGKTGTGVAMLLTLGGLGFWTLIDLFLLSGMIRDTNDRIENEVISELRLINQAKANSEVAAARV
ncbi:TM2 domain-containing protein [Paenibacillus hexagrammi]|uniref:TM2 domain-containing protein n=1 Tax=Paenibacillus hexagrammi TaxID=2908839 RepID=A0ABY3SJP3_9BACL|nr:TM2 domain-containing protein [Paenibacillus sp. YPD9-1]UJF33459.1 TM2 domain-containing protein [Paenibacillus sp. YPD9-1]